MAVEVCALEACGDNMLMGHIVLGAAKDKKLGRALAGHK